MLIFITLRIKSYFTMQAEVAKICETRHCICVKKNWQNQLNWQERGGGNKAVINECGMREKDSGKLLDCMLTKAAETVACSGLLLS